MLFLDLNSPHSWMACAYNLSIETRTRYAKVNWVRTSSVAVGAPTNVK
jgi:hypothetical protein